MKLVLESWGLYIFNMIIFLLCKIIFNFFFWTTNILLLLLLLITGLYTRRTEAGKVELQNKSATWTMWRYFFNNIAIYHFCKNKNINPCNTNITCYIYFTRKLGIFLVKIAYVPALKGNMTDLVHASIT
jgi:hypothetical protein